MISAVFRRGGDVSFVVEELKAVFDPRGGRWMDGHYVPSLLAAIGEVIERHMIDIGFMPDPARRLEELPAEARLKVANVAGGGANRLAARMPGCRNARNAHPLPSSARKAATSAPPAATRAAADPRRDPLIMRACRSCGLALGRFVEECPRCGTDNPVRLPWYGWLVGGILVLALFLAFGDIGAVIGLIERLAGFGR